MSNLTTQSEPQSQSDLDPQSRLPHKSLSNSEVDILLWVRKCQLEEDMVSEEDGQSADPDFAAMFRNLCDDGYICSVLGDDDQFYFYLSTRGMESIAFNAGQMVLPGMEETLVAGSGQILFNERHDMGMTVLTQEKPLTCLVCGAEAAYDKTHVGYPGLIHCTACGTWVDLTTNTQWNYRLTDQNQEAH